MQPNTPQDNLWNALVAGGDASRSAVANFNAQSEPRREEVLKQLFREAEAFVDHLIVEERKGNRYDFKEVKDKLLQVLDCLPQLALTDSLRQETRKRLKEIDKRSEPLTNIDIMMKCEDLEKQLKPPSLSGLKGPKVIECSSIEELRELLSKEIPADVLEEMIADIEKSGGGIVLGFQAVIKKLPPKDN